MTEWKWSVHYNDNKYYTEDELGGFSSIDQNKLDRFILYDVNNPARHFVIALRGDMRLIFFRRSKQIIDMQSGEQWNEFVCTCLGWQKTIQGTNVKHLIWIGPDDSIAVTDRDLDEV